MKYKLVDMRSLHAVAITTICIIAFYILLHIDVSILLAGIVYLSIPLMIIWMVFTVLMDDNQDYPELDEHEWGYADKDKDELGML